MSVKSKKSREEILLYQREYSRKRRKNMSVEQKSKYNEYAMNWYNKHSVERRLKVLSCVSNEIKCNKCGFDDWRALHIDHVNGGGNKDRKLNATMYNPYHLMIKIQANKGMFQLLCANCNWIKRYDNKECKKLSTNKKNI